MTTARGRRWPWTRNRNERDRGPRHTHTLEYGPLRVAVACNDAGDLDDLVRVLRPFLRPGTDGRADARATFVRNRDTRFQVRAALDGEPLPGVVVPEAVRSLLGRLLEATVRREPDWTHLHAGAVEIEGHGVLIPASSGSGKSNLVAALASGNAVLTDESVAVDRPDGLIRASPRPICLKPPSHDRGAALAPDETRPAPGWPWLLPAVALGARNAGATRPRTIVIPGRRPGPPSLADVHPAVVLEVLIAQAYDLVVSPQRSFEELAWLAATVPAVALGYEEAAEAAPLVHEHVVTLAGTRAPVPWAFAHAVQTGDPSSGPRRSPGSLGVVMDGQAVVWQPATKAVVRLDRAGAQQWADLDQRPPTGATSSAFLSELHHLGLVDLAPGDPADEASGRRI